MVNSRLGYQDYSSSGIKADVNVSVKAIDMIQRNSAQSPDFIKRN